MSGGMGNCADVGGHLQRQCMQANWDEFVQAPEATLHDLRDRDPQLADRLQYVLGRDPAVCGSCLGIGDEGLRGNCLHSQSYPWAPCYSEEVDAPILEVDVEVIGMARGETVLPASPWTGQLRYCAKVAVLGLNPPLDGEVTIELTTLDGVVVEVAVLRDTTGREDYLTCCKNRARTWSSPDWGTGRAELMFVVASRVVSGDHAPLGPERAGPRNVR